MKHRNAFAIALAFLAAGFIAESAVYWGTNACFMWVLGIACGLPMEFGHALAVMGVLALGIYPTPVLDAARSAIFGLVG